VPSNSSKVPLREASGGKKKNKDSPTGRVGNSCTGKQTYRTTADFECKGRKTKIRLERQGGDRGKGFQLSSRRWEGEVDRSVQRMARSSQKLPSRKVGNSTFGMKIRQVGGRSSLRRRGNLLKKTKWNWKRWEKGTRRRKK